MRGEVIMLVVLIAILGIFSYFLYSEVFGFNKDPVKLNFLQNNTITNITSYPDGNLEIYPNMKFNHNQITYNIDSSCDQEKTQRTLDALNIIQENVPELTFQESSQADITITCDEKYTPSETSNKYFVAGEGGPTSVINTSLFYVIEKGAVLLFYSKSSCNSSNIELHELLHVFGFEHSENKKSIMYSVSSCSQVLTQDIVDELSRLYGIENLPELYFYDVSAYKKGIYLNFEIKVKNAGLVNANNVKLQIYVDSEERIIDEFDLGEVEYGNGKYLKVENVKIPLGTKKIKFEIVNSIEINRNNNIIEFELR